MPVQVPLLQVSVTPPSAPEPSVFQTLNERRVGGCCFFFRLCIITAVTLPLKLNGNARLEGPYIVAFVSLCWGFMIKVRLN